MINTICKTTFFTYKIVNKYYYKFYQTNDDPVLLIT